MRLPDWHRRGCIHLFWYPYLATHLSPVEPGSPPSLRPAHPSLSYRASCRDTGFADGGYLCSGTASEVCRRFRRCLVSALCRRRQARVHRGCGKGAFPTAIGPNDEETIASANVEIECL